MMMYKYLFCVQTDYLRYRDKTMRKLFNRLCSSGAQMAGVEIQKPWRDSASLIIAAPRVPPSKDDSNFHILFLKRAAKSSFFPNAFVFPGGAIDEADKSPRWFELFRKIDSRFVEKIPREFFVRQTDGKRPPLFPGDVDVLNKGILPNEVAFRICAIRESFEESGVLLLTDNVAERRVQGNGICASSVTNLLSLDAVHEWRVKVHNDATEFLNLCEQLKCVPDIWSLREWSEWLTPNLALTGTGKSTKRFDAVFYSCCLKETPTDTIHDKVEMSELTWKTPKEMLQMYYSKKCLLGPPQLVELSRLLNFWTLDALVEYTRKRALMGLERWMPYFCVTKCGKRMEVLPGDDLYPDDLDEAEGQKELQTLEKTAEDIMTTTDNVFCTFFPKFIVRCNIKLQHGQIPPVNLEGAFPDAEPRSKL